MNIYIFIYNYLLIYKYFICNKNKYNKKKHICICYIFNQ